MGKNEGSSLAENTYCVCGGGLTGREYILCVGGELTGREHILCVWGGGSLAENTYCVCGGGAHWPRTHTVCVWGGLTAREHILCVWGGGAHWPRTHTVCVGGGGSSLAENTHSTYWGESREDLHSLYCMLNLWAPIGDCLDPREKEYKVATMQNASTLVK